MDFTTLSYRDIQKIAKEHKIPANKKREELIKLIEAAMTAPVEVAPVEVAPVEVAPVEVAPAEVAPVEVAPVEVAPVEVAPIEVAPVEDDFDINNLHSILNTFSDDEQDAQDEIAPIVTFTKQKSYKDVVLSTPHKEVNVVKRSKDVASQNSENFFSPPAKNSKNVLTTPLSTYKMLNNIQKSVQKDEKNTAIMNFWLTKGNTPIKKSLMNDENAQPLQTKDTVQKKLNFNCYTPFKKTRNACQVNNIQI